MLGSFVKTSWILEGDFTLIPPITGMESLRHPVILELTSFQESGSIF